MQTWHLSRTVSDELMDDPSLPAAEHHAALTALARINWISGTAAQLAKAIASIPAASAGSTLEVVDLACGGGDVTIAVARRLTRLGVAARLTGVDMSERALDVARATAQRASADVAFVRHDLNTDGCPSCDVAISSLFLHHLDDPAAERLLASIAARARGGMVISDLLRSRLGLALAVLGTTFLARSRVARVDGPLSVRAARTPEEYRDLFRRAGLHPPQVRGVWPARALIRWLPVEARS